MVRNSLRYVSWKDYKAVTADLKQIYQSATEREAQRALIAFGERWDSQYPQIARSWQGNWDNLITLFDYPPDIRKVIYTTNAIESLNSVLRKAIKQRKLFSTDDSALKVAYPGDTAGFQEMDYADPELEACPKSLYYRIR